MITLFVLLLLIAVIAGFYRLLIGPTNADRVIAFDLLFAIAVVLCICASLASKSTAFLDVAIGLSLVGFVSTIGWAHLIEQETNKRSESS